MSSSIQFDWSQGKAFVQDGTIFYSPNCSRTVLVPAQPSTNSPFNTKFLDASEFKQPIWWTDVYGWQSFIPLAPSYTSSPFEPFCWMPRIIKVDVLVDPRSSSGIRERRFQMHPDDYAAWIRRENLLVGAAERIRIWFKIPGNMPPTPSRFNYGRAYKSQKIAKEMILLVRDWFAIWMGFLSYLIASTERFSASSSRLYSQPDPDSPFPVWYHRLQEAHNYPAAWLDGLSSSTVCSFDMKTPRAGVVFERSKVDKTRPPIEWFIKHHIPVWFVWSREEEEALARDRSLAFFKPPDDLIEDALVCLFDNPATRIPLAGLIIQRYYSMGSNPVTNETVKLLKLAEAPSFVLKYTNKIFLAEENPLAKIDSHTDASLTAVLKAKRAKQIASSEAEASLPTQTMIEGVEEKGKLFNHWRDFFSKREKRQEEIMRIETPKERQRRVSREQKPPIKNTDMYTWERIQSSGGKEVYMRLWVNKKRNEYIFGDYRKHQRIYNSLANEWDLSEEFGTPSDKNHSEGKRLSRNRDSDTDSSSSDDDNDGFNCLRDQYIQDAFQDHPPMSSETAEHRLSMPLQLNHTLHEPVTPPGPIHMDVEEDDASPSLAYSQDIVQSASYGYGYVASMPGSATTEVSVTDWENALLTLGFVGPYSNINVEDYEKCTIVDFFKGLLKNTVLAISSDDLNNFNHAALRHLFDFKTIHHPSSDLFVFCAHRSAASTWLLGVHSPEVVLYVCRYILSNPGAHTVVTVATRLLERGIPFRTLSALECSSRHATISQPYTPVSFRFSSHLFTRQDFEASMLQCQTVLSQPQGRAALLKGGIIWRIAKEFLSVDGVLSGPSVEVTAHRVGYICASGILGTQYCDDELTENEIALICGSYSLYTCGSQVMVKSWFPPPICWTKGRTGVKWVEWTKRNEQFFTDLLQNIRAGNSQPLTPSEWTSRLRGLKTARTLRENNHKRATLFIDQLVPLTSSPPSLLPGPA